MPITDIRAKTVLMSDLSSEVITAWETTVGKIKWMKRERLQEAKLWMDRWADGLSAEEADVDAMQILSGALSVESSLIDELEDTKKLFLLFFLQREAPKIWNSWSDYPASLKMKEEEIEDDFESRIVDRLLKKLKGDSAFSGNNLEPCEDHDEAPFQSDENRSIKNILDDPSLWLSFCDPSPVNSELLVIKLRERIPKSGSFEARDAALATLGCKPEEALRDLNDTFEYWQVRQKDGVKAAEAFKKSLDNSVVPQRTRRAREAASKARKAFWRPRPSGNNLPFSQKPKKGWRSPGNASK
eukprot:TRINITY_DN263_c0_g1_i2.p3 TRINITY_DN263_c0_g1~~TRINITY_DN263_c0_g1_i2.p3  ORF type:complete len:299 (-),score=39.07 TRINITY_DN263_c0_g1_i2:2821-3717(-)